MADHPTPNRLLILWSMPEEYARAVAVPGAGLFVSVKLEAEVALPPDPDLEPKPTAEDVPRLNNTQAAYEVFAGIDELMGETDEFVDKAKEAKAVDRSASEALPLRVEYRATLRRALADRGAEVAFAVGVADTLDRGALLPRFLVLGNDAHAGEISVRDKREGGPGATFTVTMSEYCTLIDELRKVVDEFAAASELPLPDVWLAGNRAIALLTTRVAAHPAVLAALQGR